MKKNLFKRKFFLFFFNIITLCAILTPEAGASLFINEFSSDTSGTISDPDWVEIYNSGPEVVDLSLYRLRDDTTTNKLDLSGSLASGAFIAFDWFNKLNKTGDRIRLLLITDESNLINQVAYGDIGNDVISPQKGQSAGRKTDGENTWAIFSSATKGTSNNGSVILTNTPTPSPTETIVPTPAPTKSTTPVKTSTPKITTTSKIAVSSKSNSNQNYYFTSDTNTPVPTKLITKSVQKTLGLSKEVSSQGAKEINFLTKNPTASETPKIKTEVLGASENNILSKALIGLGTIFILACGILTIRAYKQKYG